MLKLQDRSELWKKPLTQTKKIRTHQTPTRETEPFPSDLNQHHRTAYSHHSNRKRNPSCQRSSSSRVFVDHGLTTAGTFGSFGLNDRLVALDDCSATRSIDDSLMAIDDCLRAIGSLFDMLIALADNDGPRRSSCHPIEIA